MSPEVLESSSYPTGGQITPVVIEAEINAGRRAFPVTQELFAGTPFGTALQLQCGWHDTSVNVETGAFAVVQTGAGLDDLIGEIVEVTNGVNLVYVFVLLAAGVPVQLSLARRAWMALSRPSIESLPCTVQAVQR